MKKLSPYLTFAGTIPFIACAILLVMEVDAIRILGKTEHVLVVYGVVIATFMAGAQWGNHLNLANNNSWVVRLPMFSNIIALLLWLGFLSLSTLGFIWLLIVSFIILLLIDYGLYQAQIISSAYFTVRKYVSSIVVISLVISAMRL